MSSAPWFASSWPAVSHGEWEAIGRLNRVQSVFIPSKMHRRRNSSFAGPQTCEAIMKKVHLQLLNFNRSRTSFSRGSPRPGASSIVNATKFLTASPENINTVFLHHELNRLAIQITNAAEKACNSVHAQPITKAVIRGRYLSQLRFPADPADLTAPEMNLNPPVRKNPTNMTRTTAE